MCPNNLGEFTEFYFMKNIAILIVIGLLAWFGRSFYYQNLSAIFQQVDLPYSEKLRCITKDDKVIYGNIPSGTTCVKTEEVKAKLSVIASNSARKSAPLNQPSNPPTTTINFKCDGRTHCSQMTSCEEATFFLNNCAGVQIDGNNDGVPCERQWC